MVPALLRWAEAAFMACTLCERCVINCPMGVETPQLLGAARGPLSALGKAPEILDQVQAELKDHQPASGGDQGYRRIESDDERYGDSESEIPAAEGIDNGGERFAGTRGGVKIHEEHLASSLRHDLLDGGMKLHLFPIFGRAAFARLTRCLQPAPGPRPVEISAEIPAACGQGGLVAGESDELPCHVF